MKNKKIKINGQAVLLVVFVIGGVMLGATTIAGFLMAIQLQQAGDAANSGKAIFAAEAGVNCALFNYNHSSAVPQCGIDNGDGTHTFSLSNRTSVTFTCYKDTAFSPASVVQCNDASSMLILSKGISGVVNRALLFTITTNPTPPTPPTLIFSVLPTMISSGGSVLVNWSSTNANTCIGTDDNHETPTSWRGAIQSLSGTKTFSLDYDETVGMVCINAAGTVTQQVAITVL